MPVRFVLMEGASGIGKSTLAWEVCHRWEELESVKQYKLVVLVRLREKKAQEASCLKDLLRACYATTNMNDLLTAIDRGVGILIVCDGFDELPCKQRQEGSVYINLFKGRLLPEATIIVTSRPSARADLWRLCQHNIDRHLEVIGFAKEHIEQFAESVFSGDILERFLSYINSNPHIHGMMYIPLNAVIIALIYNTNYDRDAPFPTTMAQLFDGLVLALVRRHLVSTCQVPRDYCMPTSLQRMEDIKKLPPSVAQQLLQLARLAYESRHDKRYVFTDLGKDFEHLGIMKKTTSLNVCTGPECSFSFLHLTLGEYLAALHIAIENPIGFRLVEWLEESSVVVRFLAGLYQHDDYRSHNVYQELVKALGHNQLPHENLQFVHCAHECPSIIDCVKVNYNECNTIRVEPELGFDWYATGYCISHFEERWELAILKRYNLKVELGIGLLLKGLLSLSNAKGKIHSLYVGSLSLSQTISPLKTFCQLHSLQLYSVDIPQNDVEILQQLIEPSSGLKCLEYNHIDPTCPITFIPLLFHPSSLQELTLHILHDKFRTELFPKSNANHKKLIISRNLFPLLSELIPNFTSLSYLEIFFPLNSDLPILSKIVQSHQTLKVLFVDGVIKKAATHDNLLELIEIAGSNSQLKELRLKKFDYQELSLDIRERHKHLLTSTSFYK